MRIGAFSYFFVWVAELFITQVQRQKGTRCSIERTSTTKLQAAGTTCQKDQGDDVLDECFPHRTYYDWIWRCKSCHTACRECAFASTFSVRLNSFFDSSRPGSRRETGCQLSQRRGKPWCARFGARTRTESTWSCFTAWTMLQCLSLSTLGTTGLRQSEHR